MNKKTMNRKKLILGVFALLALFVVAPAAAAEEGGSEGGLIGLGAASALGIAIAAVGGAAGQSKAAAAAVSAIARNPGAGGDIRLALILGLAFIESLVIYALLIAMRGVAFF